ncbi:MAG TPA: lipopolysaccharide heptosyltransferase II [Bacteroidota bacterium]|nr:lipopolysaccharide heptosyltransferase II [Bacteroidota bacterium]
MTADPRSILVVQTAFVGDVILTLPLMQALHERFPGAPVTAVTVPSAVDVVASHPAVARVLPYDKRGIDRGIAGLARMAARLRAARFDVALIPHRSLRSALLAALARIPVRIGFDRSAGRLLLTQSVHYAGGDHEILRNLALAAPMGLAPGGMPLPVLHPGEADLRSVDAFLRQLPGGIDRPRIAVAPGSVWATKRWPEENYAALIRLILEREMPVVLVGGPGDRELCARLARAAGSPLLADASGRFSLTGSAALIARCRALVANDSAPVHMAVAVGVPVIALFGPTVPAFGFAPAGPRDIVVDAGHIDCRPCSIHGGNRCPTGTFDCMRRIAVARVLEEVLARAS